MNNTSNYEILGSYITIKNLEIKKINFKGKTFNVHGFFDVYLNPKIGIYGKRNNLVYSDSRNKTNLNFQKLYPNGKLDGCTAKLYIENNFDDFLDLLEYEITDSLAYYNRAGSIQLKNNMNVNIWSLKIL